MTTITTSPANEQLQKIKTIAEKKFEAVQVEATELATRCSKLTISDENTLAIGSQLLAGASEINKKVETKRKELKAPYIEAGKALDEVASRITYPLDLAITTIKRKLKQWNDEQAKIQAEADKKVNAKFQLLQQIEAQLDQKVKIALTPQSCQNLIDSITEKFPDAEKFEAFAAQAMKVKASFINMLTIKKQALEASLDGDRTKVTELTNKLETITEQKIEDAAELQEIKAEVKESNVVAKSKTRKVWKIEVVDEAKLPKQFLSFDEKKAREYMAANRSKWNKEAIVGGVRFYEDEIPVA